MRTFLHATERSRGPDRALSPGPVQEGRACHAGLSPDLPAILGIGAEEPRWIPVPGAQLGRAWEPVHVWARQLLRGPGHGC
ncbi:hypothetical protein ACFOLD_11520 [Kocuria carniphila]|uniref:hypothetical protein n=1 Tax=Kocuria carniphila TaxID=262208 RepID=UPI00361325CC